MAPREAVHVGVVHLDDDSEVRGPQPAGGGSGSGGGRPRAGAHPPDRLLLLVLLPVVAVARRPVGLSGVARLEAARRGRPVGHRLDDARPVGAVYDEGRGDAGTRGLLGLVVLELLDGEVAEARGARGRRGVVAVVFGLLLVMQLLGQVRAVALLDVVDAGPLGTLRAGVVVNMGREGGLCLRLIID